MGHQGNTERIIRAWLKLLAQECTEGSSTVGGHQEEVREALADVAWVRLLLTSGGGGLKHRWQHYIS